MPKTISEEKRSFWETKIQEQKTCGLSIKAWCQQNQITPSAFQYWKGRFYKTESLTPAAFAELSSANESGIFFEYQGIRIFVEKQFDLSTLTNCLIALRGMQC